MSDKIRKDLARRDLVRAFQRAGKRKTVMEYETAQEAFRKNYERLLAEAVRNTQPRPVRNEQPAPVRNTQPEPKRNPRPRKRSAPKRTAKIKSVRASASRKRQHR